MPASYTFRTAQGVWINDMRNRALPYTRRTGAHLEELYDQGGRAVEYYMGPAHNPGVEVNIAFGGRKLSAVKRDSREVLGEVLDALYRPRDAASRSALADFFIEAEEAFFASFDPLLPPGGKARGEIHLTPLFGKRPGPPIYLQECMTPAGRGAYGRRLRGLLKTLERLSLRSPARVARIRACIRATLEDLGRAERG